MNNRFGVDMGYMTEKLGILIRDMSNYTPEELSRSLARLAVTASSDVLKESEFSHLTKSDTSPDGFSLVPSLMPFDLDAMERLKALTGDGTTEEDFSECTLWVGETRGDGGERYYGLNASLTEYPEEGAIPVIEFRQPEKEVDSAA